MIFLPLQNGHRNLFKEAIASYWSLLFFLNFKKCTALAGAHSERKVHVGVEVSNTVYKINTSRKKFCWGSCKAKTKFIFWHCIIP
jgi:hypothetical protein